MPRHTQRTRRDTQIPMCDFARQYDLSGLHGAFTAACGLHWYCVDYHGGQGDRLYALQCALRYQPGPMEHGPDPDSTDAVIYGMLETGQLDPEDVGAWIKVEYERAKAEEDV